MTAYYQYLFCDLLTDQKLASLELEQVRFDRRIIQPGSFSAVAQVPNAEVAAKVRRIVPAAPLDWHTGPGRTVCHILRNGALWGTYLIWQVTPQGNEKGRNSVALQGASLESYLNRVEIRTDLTYTGQDEITGIGAALITHMQSDPRADIGLTLNTTATGQLRDRTYKRSEAASYGQRLGELAGVDDGFEWMIRTYLDGSGTRVREWVAADRLTSSAADHVFTRPGAVVSWSYLSDATDAATDWQARGATINTDLGETSEPLMSNTWPVDELTDVGWPLLTKTLDFQTVTEFDTLQAYAHWSRNNRSGVVRIPQATVRLDDKTRFTPNSLGDYARLTIVDTWYPLDSDGHPSFSERWRIVGCEITPPSRGIQETCKLIFESGG
jgi:hypothetical protein